MGEHARAVFLEGKEGVDVIKAKGYLLGHLDKQNHDKSEDRFPPCVS